MKVLFFSPHAYFQIHALPEALVAESLKLAGHEIEIVNCNGIFSKSCLCMPMSILHDTKSREKICVQCVKNRNAINSEFDFNASNLETYVTQKDLEWVNAELAKINLNNFKHYSINGIPLGRYALYELLLELKISGRSLTHEQWEKFLPKLRNGLITYVGIQSILDKSSIDRVVLYNSLYSVNRIVSAVANSKNIPSFSLHAGYHLRDRIRQLTIFKGNGSSMFLNSHPYLSKIKETPLTLTAIQQIESHVRELVNATSPWVYSVKNLKLPSLEVRRTIGARPDQKIVLAVMRSNDELKGLRLAGVDVFSETEIFSSQIEWVDWLKEFCKEHPEIFVVFRIHPREFPNKRESNASEHAQMFLEQINKLDLPENMHLNLPTDGLSLHELLKVSDLVLNNSSTAGLEASLFGIPVLGLGGDLYAFDRSLQVEPVDLEDYKSCILNLTRTGWDFKKVIIAYRWLGFLLSDVAIDISDGYSQKLSGFSGVFSFVGRGFRRLGMPYPDITITAEVRKRNKPLKEAQKLIYAITQDAVSHIGVFERMSVGSKNLEHRLIHEAYLRLVKSVSSPNDPEIEKRMAHILTQSY
jgi:hypothetical protein